MASNEGNEDFYRLTGRVIRAWADLEQRLSGWLVELLGVDELKARIIWNSYGDLGSKLRLVKLLVRNFADQGLWSEAVALMSDVERIAGNRYILPHAFGKVDSEAGTLVFRSDQPGPDFALDFEVESRLEASTLKAWLEAIEACGARLAAFQESLVPAGRPGSLRPAGSASSSRTVAE